MKRIILIALGVIATGIALLPWLMWLWTSIEASLPMLRYGAWVTPHLSTQELRAALELLLFLPIGLLLLYFGLRKKTST